MRKLLSTKRDAVTVLGALMLAAMAPGCGTTSTPAAAATDGASGADAVNDAAIDTASTVDAAGDAAAAPCPPAAFLLDVAKGKGAGSGYAGATVTGTCTADTFTVKSNGLPFYTYVATTPNALKAVQQSWVISRAPKLADTTTALPLLGVTGFTVAGLPFYGPNEAAQPAEEIYGDPVYNGLMDGCMGHTSPQEYHNHALATKCLTAAALAVAAPWSLPEPAKTLPSPLIGWALDGFPVYGPMGCLDKECKQVEEFKSGYVKTGDPKTYAWKAYTYTAVPNDPTVLDVCNGRTEADGSYAYHATSDFPYILGCFRGTAMAQGTVGGNPGGGEPTGPTACTTNAECTNCPPGSKGCGCTDTPGGKFCVPTCSVDADCGTTPNGQKTTCNQGFCKP